MLHLARHYANRLQDKSVGLNSYQIQGLCFDFARDDLLEDLEEHDKAN